MRGATSAVEVIDGVQVNVLEGLVEGMSVSAQSPEEDLGSPQGAVGGSQIPESARSLSAIRRHQQ